MKKDRTSLQKRLLRLFSHDKYRPLTHDSLARELNLRESDADKLKPLLKQMAHRGLAQKNKAGKWSGAVGGSLLMGKVSIFSSGAGIVNCEDIGQEYFIPKRHVNGAIDGDIVLVRPIASQRSSRPSKLTARTALNIASVVTVEKHTREYIVGTLNKTGAHFSVVPENSNIDAMVLIDDSALDGVAIEELLGHRVVVALSPPIPSRSGPRLSGTITEDIGRASDPGVDVLTIARQHGIYENFSEQIESHVGQMRKESFQDSEPDRRDVRKMQTFTVDPDDARDFDDAISINLDPDGNYDLYVHIADVAHYVKAGSPLDLEARSRGNSTYLVDRVMPMLPEHLTNDVCSLRPAVDSLTHSVRMVFNRSGDLLRSESFRSIIHSYARLTYDDVQKFFAGNDSPAIPGEIKSELKLCRDLARILRRNRVAEGSLDFSIPEAKCVLDGAGRCIDIKRRGGSEACNMIEEFMLAANKVVAAKLDKCQKTAIYRAHAEPDHEDWEDLLEELKVLGVSPLPRQFSDINSALQKIAGTSGAHAFSVRILRTMKKAMYSTTSASHFGLGFDCYTHFTSPIRRYPDLVVHRLLNSIEDGEMDSWPTDDELNAVASHCSGTEIRSQTAERESVDEKRISFYQNMLNAGDNGPYKGIVIEILNKGILVELQQTLQSGLIPFSQMRDDHYVSIKRGMVAKGQRRGKTFKVGQLLDVRISKVDTSRRLVDFML